MALDDSTFVAEMPPVQYCTHWRIWQRVPPPPGWFVLRFSDAASEEYVVWTADGESDYLVRDMEHGEIGKDEASWRLEPGQLRRQGNDGSKDRWTLEVNVAPRRSRDLDPHPLVELVFFDHPSGRVRIRNAMEWKRAHGPRLALALRQARGGR